MSDKSTNISEPQISPDEYAEILKGLTLTKIALATCNVTREFGAVEAALAELGKLPLDIKDGASFELEGESLSVRHIYILASRHKRKVLVSLKAEYLLAFRVSQPINQEFFEIFRRTSLINITWPYLREFVGSMTARCDLPRLQLPLLLAP